MRKVDHYLQREDLLPQGTSACLGCPAELGLRFTLKVLGKNTILFGAASCAAGFINRAGVPNHLCLMTNIASTMEGVKRCYSAIGRDVNVVAFAGDGATADVGFQSLSGAAERGANIIYICYDNEGYMNTGNQRSSTTPYLSSTTTTPVGVRSSGKGQIAKYMPLIMAFHGIPYAATATLFHLDDYARKLEKAMEVKDGMAYIHLLCPCPTGWGVPPEASIDICRKAVKTNYFPLWEAEGGRFRLTHEVKNPEPVEAFTHLTRRYAHLTTEDLSKLQSMVSERFNLIKHLTYLE